MSHFAVALYFVIIIVSIIERQQATNVMVCSLTRNTTLEQLQRYENTLLHRQHKHADSTVILTGLSKFNINASSNSQFRKNYALAKTYYDPTDVVLEYLLQFMKVKSLDVC